MDITLWLYDEPTGLLTNKVYADGKGTAYSYTPDGKLATRTWARLSPSTGLPLQTLYSYDATHSLASISYSDSTPSVAFAYDRLGRQTNAVQRSTGVPPVVHEYRYDSTNLSLVEERLPDGTVLSRSQDALGRPAGIALGSGYAAGYAYDEFGRFHSVSSSVFSAISAANYSYLPGSHLLSGYTLTDPVSNFQFQVSRSYEQHRALIDAVSNTFGGTLVSAFDYRWPWDESAGRSARKMRSSSSVRRIPPSACCAAHSPSSVSIVGRSVSFSTSLEWSAGRGAEAASSPPWFPIRGSWCFIVTMSPCVHDAARSDSFVRSSVHRIRHGHGAHCLGGMQRNPQRPPPGLRASARAGVPSCESCQKAPHEGMDRTCRSTVPRGGLPSRAPGLLGLLAHTTRLRYGCAGCYNRPH